MKEKRLNEVKGVALIAAGLMISASLLRFNLYDIPSFTNAPNNPPHNLLGIFGAYLGCALIFIFGRIASFVLPILVIIAGVKYFTQDKPYLSWPRFVGIFVLLVSFASLIGMFNLPREPMRFYFAGVLGTFFANFVTAYFSRLGGFIIFSTFMILSLALVTGALISSLFANFFAQTKNLFASWFNWKKKFSKAEPRIAKVAKPLPVVKNIQTFQAAPQIKIKAPKPQAPLQETKPHSQEELQIGDYRLPSIEELLELPPPLAERQIKDDLASSARVLEETLGDFGISVKVTDVERGPVITRYELEPAPGVKVNRIVSLGDDIALVMKAQSVRIIAPIPGKSRVGVEVPNSKSSLVYLREVLSSRAFQDTEAKLPLALGKDIAGDAVVTDLESMPHMLIAGTTGSGKTVCVNSLILSLLFRATPAELKFVMIDPKMVELMPFNGLPHLLCPVVTDAKKASIALNWVVAEMEDRYQLLADSGVRNIEAYNKKDKKLPYIIVVIDEFADLMTVSRDQIETAVTRLAQLSRAVGIHLLLATQRPSVDVITGVIKANLPARISFKVASKVDSRTVLDMNGADKLLGKGDMLFLKPGEAKPVRLQGTLVSDKEIDRVVSFVKEQAKPVYNEEILKEQHGHGVAQGERDELYEQAVQVVMESNQASVSILQRRMRFGYTRAARVIDVMEQDGLVGPYEGSKPRRILVDREHWLKQRLPQEMQEEMPKA